MLKVDTPVTGIEGTDRTILRLYDSHTIYCMYENAIRDGKFDVVKYLEPEVNSVLRNGFIKAVQFGHLDMVKYFVEKYHVNIFDHNKFSFKFVFESVINIGSVPVLQYLMENVPSSEYSTVYEHNFKQLKIAANNGHLDVIKYLIETNKDDAAIDVNKYKKEALEYAQKNEQHHVVTYLTENIAKSIN